MENCMNNRQADPSILPLHIHDNQNGLDYTLHGDYYFPDFPEAKARLRTYGKWGRTRLDYLKNHRGEYADAYGARAPWVHTFDFKYAHDFDVKIGSTKHKLQLIANIENIGNLLNSKWGVAKQIPGTSNYQFKLLSVANAADVKKGAEPIFRMNTDLTSTWDYNHSYGQCWRLQLGVKYYFN